MGFINRTSLTVLTRLIQRVPLVGQERITLPSVHFSPYPVLVGFVSFIFFLLYFKRFVTNLFMFCPIFYLPVYYLFIELGYHIYCLHSFPDKILYTTEVFEGEGNV